MSEPAAKRHPIDLDELDRKLRAPAPIQRQGAQDDPLAELARLVSNSPDPFAPIFAAGRPDPRQAAPSQPQNAQNWSGVASLNQAPRPQRSAPDIRPAVQTAPLAEEPDWTGEDLRRESLARAGSGAESQWSSGAYPSPVRDRAARSSRTLFLVSAALAVAMVGAAGAVAMRGHVSGFGGPRTILADAAPFKVRPPVQPAKDQIENSTTLLDKSDVDKVRPAHIVTDEEQPVDLALATPGKDAQSAPVDSAFSAFPAPHRVKTILVRPDGSLISQDGAGAPASAAPKNASDGATSSEVGSDDQPATEAAASNFANVVDRAASDNAARAAAAPQSSGDPKPAGSVPPAATAKGAIGPKTPIRASAAPVSEKTADISEDAPSASHGIAATSPAPSASSQAGWAVQLAAPATEREAHAEIARLERKFARDLGGRRLTSFSAQSNGRSVWRVRIAGLSRGDAVGLCGKIKGGGGACFVAHN